VTPPQGSFPRPRPKSASPAERSAEFAETQRRLKLEAAERRLQSADPRPPAPPVDKARRRG
jgi:hypothetical protein